ncbi:hypothetical protein [uncultured Oxalicibacterium sp.]|uniref:hypothetical protein n=1 Tax=uncultured Oxalicibacterium sp. TaxID=1168540 RepID=UPI0025DF3E3C|nr:hypothetical protein [uncultured Oxalicibacterium sp.]
MKIYAAGWALQSPALNFFKQFLRLNDISISGIVYPRKVPDDLDNIPILDFEAARKIVGQNDIVLECHRPGTADVRLGAELKTFFNSMDIQTMSVQDFIVSLINKDQQNALRFPVPELVSEDIRDLWQQARFSLINDHFADLESYVLGEKLDEIFRNADWDQMLAFDKDDTPDSVLLNLIRDLYEYGICPHFQILDSPRSFLNALLKLKTAYPEADLHVEISDKAIDELGAHFEFYRRSLCIGTVKEHVESKPTYLSGSVDNIIQKAKSQLQPCNAVFFMRRSIVDYRKLQNEVGSSSHRILLRQPDTMPAHLIAALLT